MTLGGLRNRYYADFLCFPRLLFVPNLGWVYLRLRLVFALCSMEKRSWDNLDCLQWSAESKRGVVV